MTEMPKPMRAAECRVVIDGLGLTPKTAGCLPKVGERNSRFWARDQAAIPENKGAFLCRIIPNGLNAETLKKVLADDPAP